jgi:hypothetical protein
VDYYYEGVRILRKVATIPSVQQHEVRFATTTTITTTTNTGTVTTTGLL